MSFSTFHFFSCVVSRVSSAGHDACSLVFISGCCGCPWQHGRPRRDGSCWGCGTRLPHFSYFLSSSTRINGNSLRGDEQSLRQRHGWRRVAHQKQAATGRLHCQGRRLSHQSTGDDASVNERKNREVRGSTAARPARTRSQDARSGGGGSGGNGSNSTQPEPPGLPSIPPLGLRAVRVGPRLGGGHTCTLLPRVTPRSRDSARLLRPPRPHPIHGIAMCGLIGVGADGQEPMTGE